MQNHDRIDKTPRMLSGVHELQAGDILVFDHAPHIPGRGKNHGAFLTVQNQGFLNERGGHREAVHVGFIVETPQGLKLAHLTHDGFVVSDLNPDEEHYSKFLARTTHIYRPRRFQPRLAAKLAEVVAEPELARGAKLRAAAKGDRTAKNVAANFKWHAGVAVRSFVSRMVRSLKILNSNPDFNDVDRTKELPASVISKESICSRFVAEVYISACHRMSNEDGKDYAGQLMNVSPWTLPKTLQAYLYRNTNYDYYVMPHARVNLYEQFRDALMKEITRLYPNVMYDNVNGALFNLTKAQQKGRDLYDSLLAFESAQPQQEDQVRKVIALMKVLIPTLKRNTGHHVATPRSYRNLMAFARREGIHADNFTHELHDRTEGIKYGDLAAQHYGFNEPLKKLYKNYRRKGYSDEEARFECKPSFGEWYKISPVRNILLSCTGFGFLFWVLPRGCTRTREAKERNLIRQREYEASLVRPMA